MNDITPILPPELDAALHEYFAAPQPDPAFASRLEDRLRRRQVELLPGQKERLSLQSRPWMVVLRTRPLFALFIALLGLMLLTGIVYALGRLSGFIPGFGFTAAGGEVAVLSAPVESSASGITLKVDQAVSDDERFWVQLSISGASQPTRFSNAYAILPGGEKVLFISGGDDAQAEEAVGLSLLFPALPGSPQSVTLLLEGLDGQDFSLPLELRPAKAGEMLPLPTTGDLPQQSESCQGVRLVLEHIALDAQKTVFQVSLRFDQPHTWVGTQWNVMLSDEDGALYPLSDVTPGTMNRGDVHVYQTVPFSGHENLLLTLVTFPPSSNLPMFIDLSADAPAFTFVPGEKPQTGQSWELNRRLSAAGFDLKIIRATLTGESGLLFEVEPGPAVTGVMFNSPDPLVSGSTGGVPVQAGNITSGISFSGIPDHPFEVRLMRIYYRAEGTWQIHWNPPAAPSPDTKQATATAGPVLPAQAAPTLALSEPLLQQVQLLAQKFDASFRQGPGWVHVVTETVTNPSAGQTFPPPYLKSEQWVKVDEDGYIEGYVWIDYDETGNVLQQSATLGDYSVNFTTGDGGFNDGRRHLFSLDMLSTDVAGALENDRPVLHEEVACENGRSCLLITLPDAFPQPAQNPGETQAFTGAGRRMWLDLQSGQALKDESFWLLEDGSERLTSTSRPLLVEKVDAPPQEIVEILGRVVKP